jgi:hypothetical protein
MIPSNNGDKPCHRLKCIIRVELRLSRPRLHIQFRTQRTGAYLGHVSFSLSSLAARYGGRAMLILLLEFHVLVVPPC